MLKKIYLAFVIFFITSLSLEAANRYWIAGAASNWNNTANWSTTSGGVGGASVPSAADVAIFNANGLGNCNIDIVVNINGLTLNGYTGVIDLLGFSFTTGGSVTLASGTINDSPNTGSLNINSTATTIFSGTTFGAAVNTTSARVRLNGSVFNNTCAVTKNGAGNDASTGGNTFNSTLTITNTGTGYLLFGNSNPDIYNGDVTATNSGTNIIYFAHNSAGNQFNGNIILNSTAGGGIRFGQANGTTTLAATKTITIGGGGFTAGNLRFREFTQLGATPQSLTLTGTAQLYLEQNSIWNGNISFTSPRLWIRQNTFMGTASFTKTGTGGDNSYGGNIFNSTVSLINNGANNLLFAANSADTFNGDLTLITGGSGRIYLSHTPNGTQFNGNIFINYVTNQNIYIGANNGTSTLAAGKTISIIGSGGSGCGNLELRAFTQNGATAQGIALNGNGILNIGPNTTFNGDLFASAPGILLRESTFNGIANFDKTGTSANNSYGGNIFNGTTSITNSGSNYLLLGSTLPDDFNAQTTFSATGTSYISPAYASNGNTFDDDVILNSTGTSTGIRFGQAGGTSTLAATKTVTIGGMGFSTGDLRFRNFTQVGPTNQTLLCTGTARIYIQDANWGGNIDFRSPRIISFGTLYSGTVIIEKTGGIGNDLSAGGNVFMGNTQLINSGSNYLGMGQTNPDTCLANLDLINSGTNTLIYAYNSAGNIINGNLTVTNSASGTTTNMHISYGSVSTLEIAGTTTVNNNTTSNSGNIYIADQGDIIYNGTLTLNNNTIGNNGNIFFANNTNSSAIINANTSVTNSGAGNAKRVYLGNQGDVTFNGTLAIANSSSAVNSQVYCNHGANSVGLYNENITVENTNAAGDGVFFGNGNGNGTLAATKTITISGGGFIAGDLQFRNFTQVGPTNHTLLCTGTARIYNYDSNWGGNVDFRAPRMLTRGTTYNQTAILEKTGGVSNDMSVGGNTFVGDAQLLNSGSNYFGMGQTNPDVCQGNLDIINTGTHYMYYAYNSAGNTIAGNLTVSNTGSGTNTGVYVGSNANSTVTISGNCTATNTPTSTSSTMSIGNNGSFTVNGNAVTTSNGSGNNHSFYLGNAATVNINGNCTINHISNATSSNFYVASNAAASILVGGNTILSNTGANTTKRVYLGNQGDVTFNGTLAIANSSSAVNSQVYCNHGANSVGLYNENITVENTNAAGDGVFFGNGNGNGTLAATKTITISGGGFIAGDLQFRNFTQVGPTNHTLLCTGTARIYNYDSNWGGNVDFRAPRMLTRGTTYNQTAILEKTGGVSNDMSVGGNTFVGDAQLLNSGSNYFGMGQTNPDVCQGNLDIINTGTHYMYYAYNSAGNTIAGNLTVSNTGSGTNTGVYVGSNANSTVTISGNCTATNTPTSTSSTMSIGNNGSFTVNGNAVTTSNGSGNNHSFYLGNAATVNINGNCTINHTSNATSSNFYLANSTASSAVVNGITIVSNSGANTTKRVYLGNQGDVTFNGTLAIANSSSAVNSQVYCNQSVNSTGLYNDNITVENTNAAGDGVFFGNGNGNGTLAATKTITISGGGFIAGDLQFRNFTQVGPTNQTLWPTVLGTARIYNYDSNWGGNIDFRAPRMLTRGTIYNGTAFLEKNGSGNDASVGGNTFNADATLQNSGTGYFMPANNTSNDFNSNTTYIKKNTGLLYPTYNCSSTYAGNLTIDANTTVTFGAAGNGRVIFDGTITQNINVLGVTPTPRMRDVQTINPNNEIKLNTPIIIMTELDLDQGNLITDAINLIFMNDNSTVSSVSDNAFVDGPLEKIGNDPFIFPVGDSSYYRPISISNPSSGAARFRAEYFKTTPHPLYNRNLKDPSIHHVSNCEYWTLDRNATTNNVTVSLSWGDTATSCGITNINDLIVARWDGGMWKDHGNGGTTGNLVSGTVSTSGAVTSFSPFTLASSTVQNPLPIELISFNAKLNNKVVDLIWHTASEINNDYFTIEKSKDGIIWEFVTEQQGAGNSNSVINYTDVDYNPYSGVSYYRLKQTDFNGEYTYSNIVSINNTKQLISVYPNPVKGNLTITNINNDYTYKVYAADGRMIFSGSQTQLNTNNWGKGLYEIIFFNKIGVIQHKEKIIKQ